MEKFQNLLNSLGGNLNTFRKKAGFTEANFEKFGRFLGGIPGQEEVEQIRKKNPKMDIFKSGEELKKEGKMRSVDPITSEEVIVDIPDDLKEGGSKKDKEPSFKERMSMLEGMAERGANRQFLRAGIQALANSPLIGGKAALEAAKNVRNLTALNMAAMADQNLVLSQNPTKQKIAGKYFG